MLIYKDSNAEKCMYECDRCGMLMNTLVKKSIYVAGFAENPHMRWSLCQRCFRALERGIANGKKITGGMDNVK